MSKNIKIRLFSATPLSADIEWLPNDAQSHYLLNVLRLKIGDEIKVFDGQNGEYVGKIVSLSKKNCTVKILQKVRDMKYCPDLWLLFAPVKKDKTDFIIEKACELGVRKIIPTITEHTISDKVRLERYQAQAIEACEQCRRLDIPTIDTPVELRKLLANWPSERKLYYMDETGEGQNILTAFNPKFQKAAILVGPEGGFAEQELHMLAQQEFCQGVSMGKRILRAETAVAAALSCWQALCGDWLNKGE